MGYNNHEDARNLVHDLFGEGIAKQMDANVDSGQWGRDLNDIAAKLAFGEVWSRPGLDRRSRSLVTLGILISLRATEQLKLHVGAALNNGLTAQEIEEVLIHSLAYAGIPTVKTVSGCVAEVLKERGLI